MVQEQVEEIRNLFQQIGMSEENLNMIVGLFFSAASGQLVKKDEFLRAMTILAKQNEQRSALLSFNEFGENFAESRF